MTKRNNFIPQKIGFALTLLTLALVFATCDKTGDKEYTVTFDSNGGTSVDTKKTNEGTSIDSPKKPTKAGYEFAGWYKDDAMTDIYNFETKVTADITLYARWASIVYTVTFDSNGGSGAPPSETVLYGESVIKPDVVSKKAGYVFAGWYANANPDITTMKAYDFSTLITENFTLYAGWRTFNTEVALTVGYYRTLADFVSIEENVGQRFVLPLTAEANLNEILLTIKISTGATLFEDNNQQPTDLVDQEVTKKFDFTSIDSYRFRVIAEDQATDVTYTISIPAYTVAFNVNGGRGSPESQEVFYGRMIAAPDENPTREGYSFEGWYANANPDITTMETYDFSTLVMDDFVLYAGWKLFNTDATLMVNYSPAPDEITPVTESEPGVFTIPLTVDANISSISLTLGVPAGATLYENDNVQPTDLTDQSANKSFDFSVVTSHTIKVVAEDEKTEATYTLTIPTYTVTFNINGGEGSPESQAVPHGRVVTEPNEAPILGGYSFEGWYIGANPDIATMEAYDFNIPVTDYLALYAGWRIFSTDVALLVSYNDTPVTEDATVFILSLTAVTDLNTISLTLTVPAGATLYEGDNQQATDLVDQTFTGDFDFAVANQYQIKVLAEDEITEATYTLTIPTYTVTFDANGGTQPPEDQMVFHGRVASMPDINPIRMSNAFRGWYTNAPPINITDATYAFNTLVTSDITLYAGWVSTDVALLVSYNNIPVTENAGEFITPLAADVAVFNAISLTLTVPVGATLYEGNNNQATDLINQTIVRNFNFFTNSEYQIKVLAEDEETEATYTLTIPTYTVTFDANGGTQPPEDQMVFHGRVASMPDINPIRMSNAFEGWYTNVPPIDITGATYNFNTPVTSALTLYAGWVSTDVALLVSYNDTPVTEDATVFILPLTAVTDLNTISLTLTVPAGATLYRDNNEQAIVLENQILTEDFNYLTSTEYRFKVVAEDGTTENTYTLTIPTYTVAFNVNGGEGSPEDQMVLHGRVITEPNDVPTRMLNAFRGWYTNAPPININDAIYAFNTLVTSDITLYAGWVSTDVALLVSYNDTPVTENATVFILPLTAVTDLNTISLTLTVPAGATLYRDNNEQAIVLENQILTEDFNYLTSTEYRFKVVAEDGTTENTYTLTIPTYTVTFDSNGGTQPPEDQMAFHGRVITEPNDVPTRMLNAFRGWYTNAPPINVNEAIPYDFNTPITSDITLYAGWVSTDVAFKFEYQGTSFSSSDLESSFVVPVDINSDLSAVSLIITVPAGATLYERDNLQAITLVNQTLTRDFDYLVATEYWFTVVAEDGITDRDYAIIIPLYIVSFDINEGVGFIMGQIVSFGRTSTMPNTPPTRTGYAFRGWYTAAPPININDAISYDFNTPITRSITLYAGWASMDATLLVRYNDTPVTENATVFTIPLTADAALNAISLTLTVSAGATLYEGNNLQATVLENQILTKDFDFTTNATYQIKVLAEDETTEVTYTITITPFVP